MGVYVIPSLIFLTFSILAATCFISCGDNQKERTGRKTPAAAYPESVISPGVSQTYSGQEELSSAAIIALTNKVRAEQGLSPLLENILLNDIAKERVQDMFQKQYIAHISPTGEGATDAAQKIGYRYRLLAENIGSGTFINNQKVLNNWMQSPGHRKNILSSDTNEIGVSIEKGMMKEQLTWVAVQIFGLQSPSVGEDIKKNRCVPPSSALKTEIEKENAELTALADTSSRMGEEIDREKRYIDSYQRGSGYSYQRDQDAMTATIELYNQKIQKYNQLLGQIRAKKTILQQMINEYNASAQRYNVCVQ
jgi:uncharacterized protein YkwD